jgi:hypothetical protein
MVFWVMTPCSYVVGGPWCLHLEGQVRILLQFYNVFVVDCIKVYRNVSWKDKVYVLPVKTV